MTQKILIVDDEIDILRSVKQGLENIDKNLEIIVFNSGEKCLEYLKKCDALPELILLDIMMPGLDGWQVLNKIKEENTLRKIPLIFLTAKTDDFTKTFGKSQTVDFIEKPFEIDDLKHRIDKILKNITKDKHSID